jgi:hypothetical protein
MKKYLKTFEDIEALRNTDTKIYCEREDGYLKFVNGWPCKFLSNGDKIFGCGILLSDIPYIEVPDKPDESWIGKLGWVSDESKDKKTRCGVLVEYLEGHPHPYKIQGGLSWKYFTPLTPEEVEKYTGYKVVKED